MKTLNKIQNMLQVIFRTFLNACAFTLIVIILSNMQFTKQSAKEIILPLMIYQITVYLMVKGYSYISSVSFDNGNFNSKRAVSDEKILELTCIHEAGHAVVAHSIQLPIEKVCATEEAGKVVLQNNHYKLLKKNDFLKIALMCYGSAAAEEAIFNEIHGGCIGSEEADFERAEEYIKNYILLSSEYPHKTLIGTEERIKELSEELYNKACQIISDNIEKVKQLAEELKNKEELTAEEVDKIIDKTM